MSEEAWTIGPAIPPVVPLGIQLGLKHVDSRRKGTMNCLRIRSVVKDSVRLLEGVYLRVDLLARWDLQRRLRHCGFLMREPVSD